MLAGLTPAQATALDALLSGTSVKATAELAGVDRRTVHRWLTECEPFRNELALRRREMWRRASDRLRALVGPALTVLRDQLDVIWENTSFRAASTILRLANVKKLAEDEMKEARE
ncbi:MAG TPA: hypothetical protein VGR35_08465 [Tepidisphaeraceae bacterium]|nr:hypothetical protein [Tepidisphaeraceae bacterium]